MTQSIPFLVEAKLDSPVIISPEAYLTLDSLLSASCQMFGDDDKDLPLLQTDGLYHASAGILVGNPISSEAPFISRMTLRDYADTRILPNNITKKRSNLLIKPKAFPDKPRLDRYPLYHYPRMIWFGCGDPDKTLAILSRLPGIGKRCNSGYGQIGSLSILPLPYDFSIKLPDETPARPIPVSLCPQFGVDTATSRLYRVTYSPDYFDFESNADMCAIPTTRHIPDSEFAIIKEAA